MMKQLAYSFQQDQNPIRYSSYTREELERMTILQLRDICEQEKIIHAATDKMDREELIHLVMRFRGSRVTNLIRSPVEGGYERVEKALMRTKKHFLSQKISVPAKLVVYEGLDTNLFDGYSMAYNNEFDGVNCAVLDKEGHICGILNLESYPGQDKLYITRGGLLPCREAPVRDYRIFIFPQKLSDLICRIYAGASEELPSEIQLYAVPLLDFIVRRPVLAPMPLVIDFGTSNTTAGIYIDSVFFEKIAEGLPMSGIRPGSITYVEFIGVGGNISPVLPSVIGVDWIDGQKIHYNVGFDAEKMIDAGYMNDGFSVFNNIKRWVNDYTFEEELNDFQGNRLLVSRKNIVRAYLLYVIQSAEQRFKCRFSSLYLPFPVKQRERFVTLYHEALPDYEIADSEMLDEGVSVLYSTIGSLIETQKYEEGAWYKALIVDCGGGTTDLSSCEFSIRNERIAYQIDIETAYENGDTDFGGVNLTYRILQLLKIAAVAAFTGESRLEEVAASLDTDIFRMVDDAGADSVYETLNRVYKDAEQVIPTRFKEYEFQSKEEYYKVKNNYYYLFSLAESVKKVFFSNAQVLRIAVGSTTQGYPESDLAHLFAARWKLAVRQKDELVLQKVFPTVVLNTTLVRTILKADIYEIIHRFLERLYEGDKLSGYNIIKLTGQSCKIDLFRECIKEFVPGRMIQQKQENAYNDYKLKLSCLDGAIRHNSDRRLGVARVNITSKMPALPYVLSAFTHTGQKVVLVHSLNRNRIYGYISRTIESVELRLHLGDAQDNEKYIYTIYCAPAEFKPHTYEEICAMFGDQIPQDDVDTIENGEVRYFVWADGGQWGFSVVPISRSEEQLRVGARQLFPFENDGWMCNYFDGLR